MKSFPALDKANPPTPSPTHCAYIWTPNGRAFPVPWNDAHLTNTDIGIIVALTAADYEKREDFTWAADANGGISATEKDGVHDEVANIADGYPLAKLRDVWRCQYHSEKARVGSGQPTQMLLDAGYHHFSCEVFDKFLHSVSNSHSRQFHKNILALKQHFARGAQGEAPPDLLHKLEQQAYAVGRFFFPATEGGVVRLNGDYATIAATEGALNVMLANVASNTPPYSADALPSAILAAYLPERIPSVSVSITGHTDGMAIPGTTLTVRYNADNVNAENARANWFSCTGGRNIRGSDLRNGREFSYVVHEDNVGFSVCAEILGLTANIGGKPVAAVASASAVQIVRTLPTTTNPPAQGGGTGG